MTQATYNSDAYERGRPDYPKSAVEHLVGVLQIREDSTVLDLAAGTGKFTKHILAVAGSVIAIEPEESMRDELADRFPGVLVHDGRGTSIPLPDGSVDVVTIAQAFHWFANAESLEEIARVLRPGGRLGLIWNVRDLSAPAQQALERIYAEYRTGSPNYRGTNWRALFVGYSPFGPINAEVFHHLHVVDEATLLALVLSMSYMSGLPEDEVAAVERSVAAVFEEHAESGDRPVLELPYRTDVFWTHLK